MPGRKSKLIQNFLLPIISTLFITYISFNPNELKKVPSIIKFLIKNDQNYHIKIIFLSFQIIYQLYGNLVN